MRGLVIGDYWIGQSFQPVEIPLGEWELRGFDLEKDEIKVSLGCYSWAGPLEEFKKAFCHANAIPQA